MPHKNDLRFDAAHLLWFWGFIGQGGRIWNYFLQSTSSTSLSFTAKQSMWWTALVNLLLGGNLIGKLSFLLNLYSPLKSSLAKIVAYNIFCGQSGKLAITSNPGLKSSDRPRQRSAFFAALRAQNSTWLAHVTHLLFFCLFKLRFWSTKSCNLKLDICFRLFGQLWGKNACIYT